MDGHSLSAQGGSVLVKRGMYHDVLDASPEMSPAPDFAIAFNAGIWGYNDWDDTIGRLNAENKIKPRFFVVTSYTVQEAEEDAEKIKSLWRPNRCLWEADENRWGSRVERKTKGREEDYYENKFWGCWGTSD